MFLIVGEIIRNEVRGEKQMKSDEKNQFYDNFLNNPQILQKFWKLMEKEGYLMMNDEGLIVNERIRTEIDYIISRGTHFKYTKEILEQFPNLKKIFLFQIGNDNVDLEYCKKRGIEVINFISQKSVYSVAEQTVASLIGGIRQIFTTGCNLKKGVYSRQPIGKNLEDLTIGVMGCGRIGQKVIDLLQVLPCKIITYDIIFEFNKKEDWLLNLEKDLAEKGVEITGNLDYFLQKSNYISVHIPGFNENLGLLNYSKLQNIEGVVNMARAGIVVEEDVLKLLDENKLEFYVSDVVEGEPYIEKINKKLINHPKVFITPHIGANTVQVQTDIMREFLEYYLR